MSYVAQRTGQITEQGDATSSLAVHEDRGDGTPLCNQPIRPWRGKTMVFTPQGGPATVTCGHCERSHNVI